MFYLEMNTNLTYLKLISNFFVSIRYLLRALDMFWHEDCLKCGCCDCRLGEAGSTLYTRANLILCRRDYLRWHLKWLNRAQCEGDNQSRWSKRVTLNKNDSVLMRWIRYIDMVRRSCGYIHTFPISHGCDRIRTSPASTPHARAYK